MTALSTFQALKNVEVWMNKLARIILPVFAVISLVLVVLWQIFWVDNVNFYITSVAILVLSMLPFFIDFEYKKITTKELTLVATFIALAVVSRMAFYLIPQVKPIGAVVVVSGVCLGAKRGYIVGVFSAFVSNFMFGQGFWTPFQMVAMGMIGLVAGLVFKKLKATPISLGVVGFVLAFLVYGLIVDMSTIISVYGNKITLDGIISIYMSGAPFSAVFGLSTALFLAFFGKAFITKVDRVNKKYGLIS